MRWDEAGWCSVSVPFGFLSCLRYDLEAKSVLRVGIAVIRCILLSANLKTSLLIFSFISTVSPYSGICNLTKEEREYMNSGKGHQEHIKWIESKCYINEISKIWDQQNLRFCPKWGTGGRKDDQWTHITWSKCNIMFCYVWWALINKNNKFAHNDIDKKLVIHKRNCN